MNISLPLQRFSTPGKIVNPKEKAPAYAVLDDLLSGSIPEKQLEGKHIVSDITIRHMESGYCGDEVLMRASSSRIFQNIWITFDLRVFPDILNYGSGKTFRLRGKIRKAQGDDLYIDPIDFSPAIGSIR